MNFTSTLRPVASGGTGPTLEESRALTPGLTAGFLGIAVALGMVLVIGLANLANVYEHSNAVAHTNAIQAQLESLLATLLNAETGERGFVITGERSYLEPYNGALAAIPPEITRVRELTADNREQQADVDRVSGAITVKLDELARAVQQRREVGFEAARAVVISTVGKQTMDLLRVVVGRMEAREDALLTVRTSQAARAYRTARVTTIVGTGVGLLVVAGLFFVTRRVAVERTRAANVAERLRVTLSSIGDGVIATDDSRRVTQLNPVAEALTGWKESEAVGRPLEEIFVIINEDTRAPVENPIRRVLRDRVIVGLANHTVLMARNGPEIPVDDSAAPIKDADDRVVGAVLVFRDVTERRRVERERSRLITELETAVRARDDFLSIASHELRNPVNAVQLQLIGALRAFDRERDAINPETLRDRITQTNAQVGRLTRLLDNLLDVSRISAGSIVLEPETVDLRDVVQGVVGHLDGEAAPGQIRVNAHAAVVGHWDRLRVEQIVANLLSNAIKYGNGEPIDVSLDGDGRLARLTVIDRGIGIHPKQQERLFQRFERGVSGRQYGGFGLGLWITRQVVEAMQGNISVDSRPGHGSTFSVQLPLTTAATSETRISN